MTHAELLEALEEQFGVDLLKFDYDTHKLIRHRSDALACGFRKESDVQRWASSARVIRGWMEDRGWQFARRLWCPTPDSTVEHVFFAPIIRVEIDRGYHATRLVSVRSIFANGLLPSESDRQTTADRLDCESNIYVCDKLGTPSDAGQQGSMSAHWWCDHLATKNRFNDPQWAILEIDFAEFVGWRLYRDLCSESGTIVGGVEAIPPHAIRLVFPDS